MSRKHRAFAALVLFLASICSQGAFGFQAMDALIRNETGQPTKCPEDSSQFFAPHEVNSFMFKKTTGDDPSSEFNLSMRYFFREQIDQEADSKDAMGTTCKRAPFEKKRIWGFNPFFSYTGKYDFYWLPPMRETRPSAPVISRYQNPAIHLRYQFNDNGTIFKERDWFDFGVEHISNGQALTAKDNQALLQNAYQTGNHAMMDTISRVGAIVAFTAETQSSFGSNSDLTAKFYLYRRSQEADIYWGRFANQNVDFNDFQILKLQWRTKYYGLSFTKLPWQIGAEMNIGRKGFSEDSWNFMLNMPVEICGGEVPFALTMHRGPMNNLSDYTMPQNTFAVGFTFAY